VIEKLDPTSAMIGDESPYVQMFGKTEYVPHAPAYQRARLHACVEGRFIRTCDTLQIDVEVYCHVFTVQTLPSRCTLSC
jgi:hypothetical protein